MIETPTNDARRSAHVERTTGNTGWEGMLAHACPNVFFAFEAVQNEATLVALDITAGKT